MCTLQYACVYTVANCLASILSILNVFVMCLTPIVSGSDDIVSLSITSKSPVEWGGLVGSVSFSV